MEHCFQAGHAVVNSTGRHQGVNAICSSIASDLIADSVPYPIMQNVLGHANPNAIRMYVAIDIEQLRKYSLECSAATGKFLSYLEGGEWR